MAARPKVQIVFAPTSAASESTSRPTEYSRVSETSRMAQAEPVFLSNSGGGTRSFGASGIATTTVRQYGLGEPTSTTTTRVITHQEAPSKPAAAPAPSSLPAKNIMSSLALPTGPAARQERRLSNSRINTVCEAYEEIKRNYKQTKRLWTDPDFPADIKSVYPSTPERKIDWKRPKDIIASAKLFSGGVSRFDVQQGELGDCWVLAAVASLSMHPQLFERVVPSDQDFEENYCGAFHFKFWKFGEWVDVIVDDRLPVDRKELLFMHSKDSDEFWSALLEKAYAKLNGCYENLVGGVQAEALEDFTGGLCEVYNLADWKTGPDRFQQLLRYVKMSSLMGCSIDAEDDEIEQTLPNGLIVGHAYTVTDVKQLKTRSGEHLLVRVRNPWGDSSEWNGAWSDGSSEWKTLTQQEKDASQIVFDDDGEFWMNYKDFVSNFTKLEVCHLGLDSLGDDDGLVASKKKKTRWESTVHNGSWKRNVNAGGCRNNVATFWTNPQFVVDVIDPDESDDEDKGQLLIGLMQKDMRMKHLDFWTIGYSIYKLPANHTGTLDQKFFRVNKMVDKSPQYVNQREIVGRHKLDPGKYAIIPTTFQHNEEADFMLRIFSEKPNDSNELDVENAVLDIKLPTVPPAKKLEEEQRLENLRMEFMRLSGPMGQINAVQLGDILNAAFKSEFKFKGFNIEVCRSMVTLMDFDLTGKMSFEEFANLWKDLQIWKKVFKEHDEDCSGAFDVFELRNALMSSGYKVTNKVFTCLANRYSDPEQGNVSFEDFVLLQIRLKNAFMQFKAHYDPSTTTASFNEEDLLVNATYL